MEWLIPLVGALVAITLAVWAGVAARWMMLKRYDERGDGTSPLTRRMWAISPAARYLLVV